MRNVHATISYGWHGAKTCRTPPHVTDDDANGRKQCNGSIVRKRFVGHAAFHAVFDVSHSQLTDIATVISSTRNLLTTFISILHQQRRASKAVRNSARTPAGLTGQHQKLDISMAQENPRAVAWFCSTLSHWVSHRLSICIRLRSGRSKHRA